MRRISKLLTRLAGTAALSLFAMSFADDNTALAAADSHCFAKSGQDLNVVTMDDVDIELEYTTDPERKAALEEFERRQWAMRRAQSSWLDDGSYFPKRGGTRLTVGDDGRLLIEPYDAMDFDFHQERMNSITGSKYFYISPAMKKLARERAQLRAIKRKPCNPHILYLGG